MYAESQTEVFLIDLAQIPLYLVNMRQPVATSTENWNKQTILVK